MSVYEYKRTEYIITNLFINKITIRLLYTRSQILSVDKPIGYQYT